MRTIVTILVLFHIQCMYLHVCAKSIPEKIKEGISNSCIFGVQFVSIYGYNSHVQGQKIEINELCDNIDPSQQIFFLVHGFTSSANSSYMQNLATQLAKHNFTVFLLDWSQGACKDGIPILRLTEYPSAMKNTREIGLRLANYTTALIEKCSIPLTKISYIGHSLGAHVSGFAAKIIQEKNLGKIPFIIGADPAAPLFSHNKCHDRICESDAENLIILHTSKLGMSNSIGHTDLYFNDGKKQPGCGIDLLSCPHRRAITYITDILKNNNCGFPGVSNSLTSYPNSNTTDCIIVTTNILDHNNPMKGIYHVFVDKNTYCTSQTFNCKQ